MHSFRGIWKKEIRMNSRISMLSVTTNMGKRTDMINTINAMTTGVMMNTTNVTTGMITYMAGITGKAAIAAISGEKKNMIAGAAVAG